MAVARFGANAHLPTLVDQALAQDLVVRGPSVSHYLLLSQVEFQRGNFAGAMDHLREGMRFDNAKSDKIWTAIGHLNFKQEKVLNAYKKTNMCLV